MFGQVVHRFVNAVTMGRGAAWFTVNSIIGNKSKQRNPSGQVCNPVHMRANIHQSGDLPLFQIRKVLQKDYVSFLWPASILQ